mgnify:CR=1 FL=1
MSSFKHAFRLAALAAIPMALPDMPAIDPPESE